MIIYNILSVREHPEEADRFIRYFQSRWASEDSMMVYDDCIRSALSSDSPLPQWYLLMDGDKIVGGAGLITNDFVSRMDLYPWICALYIEEEYRGHGLGSLLLDHARKDAGRLGYKSVYLLTDHIGYYEHYGFTHIGTGYQPWGDASRIYAAPTA